MKPSSPEKMNAVTVIDGAAKQILECDDASRRIVTVPEWGTDIELRSISVMDRSTLFTKYKINQLEQFGSNPDALIWLFVRGTYDIESGKPLFAKDEHTAALLKGKRPDVIDRLVQIILQLSGMVKQSTAEVEKN
jgi:hypothetical protein